MASIERISDLVALKKEQAQRTAYVRNATKVGTAYGKFAEWAYTKCENAKEWWNAHEAEIKAINKEVIKWIDRTATKWVIMAIIGILMNVVVHFVPDFAERFPVVYGVFDGALQLLDYVFGQIFKLFASLFTGNFTEAWNEYDAGMHEMFEQFKMWVASL